MYGAAYSSLSLSTLLSLEPLIQTPNPWLAIFCR